MTCSIQNVNRIWILEEPNHLESPGRARSRHNANDRTFGETRPDSRIQRRTGSVQPDRILLFQDFMYTFTGIRPIVAAQQAHCIKVFFDLGESGAGQPS